MVRAFVARVVRARLLVHCVQPLLFDNVAEYAPSVIVVGMCDVRVCVLNSNLGEIVQASVFICRKIETSTGPRNDTSTAEPRAWQGRGGRAR